MAANTQQDLEETLSRWQVDAALVREHIWAWVRADVTANTCFGAAAKVRAQIDPFLAGLATRKEEVTQRCRTELQSRADALDTGRAAPSLRREGQQAA